MNFEEYQAAAQRTSNTASEKEKITTGAMGLAGEAGEVIDLVKKHLYQGHALDREDLIDEASDCLWYIAEIATGLGVTLEDIAQHNIDKLKQRYPDGFSASRSRNRDSEPKPNENTKDNPLTSKIEALVETYIGQMREAGAEFQNRSLAVAAWVADDVFKIPTYDTQASATFGAKILDVMRAIRDGETVAYIEVPGQNYYIYLAVCALLDRMGAIDWGVSIHVPWLDYAEEWEWFKTADGAPVYYTEANVSEILRMYAEGEHE